MAATAATVPTPLRHARSSSSYRRRSSISALRIFSIPPPYSDLYIPIRNAWSSKCEPPFNNDIGIRVVLSTNCSTDQIPALPRDRVHYRANYAHPTQWYYMCTNDPLFKCTALYATKVEDLTPLYGECVIINYE